MVQQIIETNRQGSHDQPPTTHLYFNQNTMNTTTIVHHAFKIVSYSIKHTP